MAWLITGGAGYLGAHVVRAMLATDRQVVVLDDLSSGSAERLPADVPLIRGDTHSRRSVRRALDAGSEPVTGLIHLAMRADAAESVQRPLYYWSQNVGGLLVVLEELVEAGVRNVILGSSADVYGRSVLKLDPAERISERTPLQPTTPFGATVVAAEEMIAATAIAEGWRSLSLRMFPLAGAAAPELGPTRVEGFIPEVLQALHDGQRPRVFGDDFNTEDGSAVHDLTHPSEAAAAFVAAVRAIELTQATTATTQDAGAVMRAAGDQLQTAAARAEEEARKLPGVALAADVAAGTAAAAEAASAAALRAMDRLPGLSLARRIAERSIEDALTVATGETVVDQMGGALEQVGSLVARMAGVDDNHRIQGHEAINIGRGRGRSSFRTIEALRESVGEQFAVDIVRRRAGDPASVVANTDLARRRLGWRARGSLQDITDSAWEAWKHDHT